MTANFDKAPTFSITTFKDQPVNSKKRGVTFGVQSAESIPCQIVTNKQNKKKDIMLPINFFHTPGEYNKMLIQLSSNQKINSFDRQVGILRSLQYINEPIFDKEKQKRQERVRQYENKKKEEKSIKTESRISKCICCCCDNFCEECATNTYCEGSQCIDQNASRTQSNSKNWLIDIEGMKRGEYKKKKSSRVEIQESELQRCHPRKEHSNYRIEQLISNTLIQTIQEKRDKQLEQLIKKEQMNALKHFNQSVRSNNRYFSAQKSKSKVEIKPTKSQIRQAYWQSIKDLIAYELKKPHQLKIQKKFAYLQPECHKRSTQKYEHFKSSRIQKQRGKSAQRQLKKLKMEKVEKEKNRMKKLLVLDSKQRQIIKNCRSKRFKPNQRMIQSAFAHFV